MDLQRFSSLLKFFGSYLASFPRFHSCDNILFTALFLSTPRDHLQTNLICGLFLFKREFENDNVRL